MDIAAILADLDDAPRIRHRNDRPVDVDGGAVVYWMQRAQRARDNPALDVAIDAGNALGKPVVVFHGLTPRYPGANERHYAFLIDGLAEIARGVEARGAVFTFRPYPGDDLIAFCAEVRAALVVGDENPLREPERWRRAAGERLPMRLVTVDADVVVPGARFPKEEWAARTLRPKITRLLDEFLRPGREPRARVRFSSEGRPASESIEPARLLRDLPLDRGARPVPGMRGGPEAGEQALADFVERRLSWYDEQRNRPENAEGTSLLSAYLHFGHLGPRGVALAVAAVDDRPRLVEAKAAFLEQLIVRRELAVNFVSRNPAYDAIDGFPAWARKTLDEHAADPRPHVYSDEALERGETHDPLWNAAQREMVQSGRTHGYVRMYWAKKLLEWTEHPARALAVAIRLNDRYFLDGRDPNGYANIAWAIGGKHDRPWAPARPIFGMVRYMSYASTSKKFDCKAYVARVAALEAGRT